MESANEDGGDRRINHGRFGNQRLLKVGAVFFWPEVSQLALATALGMALAFSAQASAATALPESVAAPDAVAQTSLPPTVLSSLPPLTTTAQVMKAPIEKVSGTGSAVLEAAPSQPTSLALTAPDVSAPTSAPMIIVTGESRQERRADPLEKVNVQSFRAVQLADRAVIGPSAMAYKHHLPEPLRNGIHNIMYNMREPANFVAFLLEHRIGKAAETLARFGLNSTMGWGGIFDVAKRHPFNLPYRPNGIEDVAAIYGVGPGPYFFVPLVGPTTLRDFIGVTVDQLSGPAMFGGVFRGFWFGLGWTVVGGLDDRVRMDPVIRTYRDQASNPYQAMRNYYFWYRRAEIDRILGKTVPSPPDPRYDERNFSNANLTLPLSTLAGRSVPMVSAAPPVPTRIVTPSVAHQPVSDLLAPSTTSSKVPLSSPKQAAPSP